MNTQKSMPQQPKIPLLERSNTRCGLENLLKNQQQLAISVIK